MNSDVVSDMSRLDTYQLGNKYHSVYDDNELGLIALQYGFYDLADDFEVFSDTHPLVSLLENTSCLKLNTVTAQLDHYIAQVNNEFSVKEKKQSEDEDDDDGEERKRNCFNSKRQFSKFLLHFAIVAGRCDVVDYLFDRLDKSVIPLLLRQQHPSLNVRSRAAVSLREERKTLAIDDEMAKRRARVLEFYSLSGYTPLMLACHVANVDMFELVVAQHIKHDVPLNSYNDTEYHKITPFFVACTDGQYDDDEYGRSKMDNKTHIARRLYLYCNAIGDTVDDDDDNRIHVDEGDDYEFSIGQSRYHQPVLIRVSERGRLAMVTFLVEECGARVKRSIGDDYHGRYTGLSRALSNGHLDVVRYLLRHGDDWKHYYEDDRFYNIRANYLIRTGTVDMLQDYIRENEIKDFLAIETNATRDPLLCAAHTGRVDMFAYLLSTIPPNTAFRTPYTQICSQDSFLENAHVNILSYLSKHHPAINLTLHSQYKSLPRMMHCFSSDKIMFLVAHLGVNVKEPIDGKGNTVLHQLVRDSRGFFLRDDNGGGAHDFILKAKLLLSYGLSMNKSNSDGDTPFTLALGANCFDVMCALLEDAVTSANIDLKNVDNHGAGIVHWLIAHQRLHMLTELKTKCPEIAARYLEEIETGIVMQKQLQLERLERDRRQAECVVQ